MPEVHERFNYAHDHFHQCHQGVPDGIAQNSSVAATSWGGGSIRVYFQDNEGFVRESVCEGGSWSAGAKCNRLVKAKPYSPLAVVSLGGPSIRLYYVDEHGRLREHSHEMEWSDGGLGGQTIHVDHSSKLAATRWWDNGSLQIRIYYQAPHDQTVQEFCWCGDHWQHGTPLFRALQGASLAACSWGNGSIRVYFQAEDGAFHEAYVNEGGPEGWNSGEFGVRSFYDAQIAATALDGDRIRVYYQTMSGRIAEACSESGWEEREFAHGFPHCRLAVVHWPENSGGTPDMKLIYQSHKDVLSDETFNQGSWFTNGMVPTQGY